MRVCILVYREDSEVSSNTPICKVQILIRSSRGEGWTVSEETGRKGSQQEGNIEKPDRALESEEIGNYLSSVPLEMIELLKEA